MSVLEKEWDLKVKVKDKHVIVTVNDSYTGRHRIREVIPVKDQYVLVGYFIGRVLREYDELKNSGGMNEMA